REVVGEAVGGVAAAQPDAIAHRPLRVGVDDESLEAAPGEGGAEVHGGGRLADAPLLAHDGENVPHAQRSCSWEGVDGADSPASPVSPSPGCPASGAARSCSSVVRACRIHRSASAPLGGAARKASRCCAASAASPFLSSRKASP